MFRFRHFLFIPSFHLLITFSIAYFFYIIDIISWEQPPLELHYWCIITILCAFLSTATHAKRYSKVINSQSFSNSIKASFQSGILTKSFVIACMLIGVIGIVKYILDYSNYLGTFGIFYSVFLEDTGQLRSLAENVDSSGTQLSYFSWIAAFIITAQIGGKQLGKKWWWLVVIIILLNSIFLDRTRPFWLIFTCALIFFIVTFNQYSRKQIITFILSGCIFLVGIFILIGFLLGKGSSDSAYTKFNLPTFVQPIFLYLTSSFAYLGRLIENNLPYSYTPERITYPLQKILAGFHFADRPPSQILDFFSLPLLTNVGTFLEPFFQDGGRVFLVIAIILHTFVFDKIALRLMSNLSIAAIIIISTLCFINFIGFFVPKIAATATWFIILFSFIYQKINSAEKSIVKLSH